MYYDYYGFSQPPFRITPDTSLFYPGGNRGAILDALVFAVLNGEGIVKVVGEVGSGKTMLCRMLEQELPDRVDVVYLANPSLSPENTLHAIAFELKLDVAPDTTRFEVMNALQNYLLQRHAENRQVVVFVEEAQGMPLATLEEIRLLSNLETRESKLLQIVLFGQPELDEMISRPEIRQLRERITYSFELPPFRTNDIREYLNSRVRACGYRAGELFEPGAIREIEKVSQGLVRRINILADKALLAAYADNARQVTGKHARLAARDSEFSSGRGGLPVSLPGLLVGVLVLVLLGIGGVWLTRWMDAGPVSVVESPVPSEPGPEVSSSPPAQPVVPVATATPSFEPVPIEATPDLAREAAPEPPSTPAPAEILTEAAPEPEPVTTPAADEISVSPVTVPAEGVMPAAGSAPESAMTMTQTPVADAVTTTVTEAASAQERDIEDPRVENPDAAPTGQLLGLAPVYTLQDYGDPRLNSAETIQLEQQLLRLPPESTESVPEPLEGEVCDRCRSIIYRPVR